MKKTIVFLFPILLASACNFQPTPIDIEIEEPPQQLVVSSFLIAPQETAVTLTRTFTALVDDDSLNLEDSTNAALTDRIFVNRGLVSIENAGTTHKLYQLAPAVFATLDLEHQFGETYRLFAFDSLTGLSVRAETQLLPQVDIDAIMPVSQIVKLFNDTTYTYEIQLKDPPGQTNYYLLTATNIAYFREATTNLGNSLFTQTGNNFNVFSDLEYGDGNRIKFSPQPFAEPGDTVVVGLSNITKGYFEFLSAYKRSGNLISQLAGEPINLPTNVEGGYGYFAMIRPRLAVVVMK